MKAHSFDFFMCVFFRQGIVGIKLGIKIMSKHQNIFIKKEKKSIPVRLPCSFVFTFCI